MKMRLLKKSIPYEKNIYCSNFAKAVSGSYYFLKGLANPERLKDVLEEDFV